MSVTNNYMENYNVKIHSAIVYSLKSTISQSNCIMSIDMTHAIFPCLYMGLYIA